MHKSHTRLFQSLDQLHHIRLRLILHRHHSDEHLMALHLEASLDVRTILLLVTMMMVMGVQLVGITMRGGHRTAALLMRIGVVLVGGRGKE